MVKSASQQQHSTQLPPTIVTRDTVCREWQHVLVWPMAYGLILSPLARVSSILAFLKTGLSNCLPSSTVVDCGNGTLNNPTDGQVSFMTTTFGSTATYSCNTGYNLQGVATRTCLANGLWSASEPTCQSKLNISIPENWLE